MELVPTEPDRPKARKPTRPASVHNVWAVIKHYRERWNHQRRYRRSRDGKAWCLIQARLAEGWTVAELCQAIDGYHLSPFHQGQNDKGLVYLDLELIMRDETHAEKGIEMSENPPKPNGGRPAHDIRLGRVGAEECIHGDETGPVAL